MQHTNRTLIADHTLHLQRRNLRPSTIYQRQRVLHRMQAQHPERSLLDLTGDDIALALDARRIEPGTRACEITHLAQFYDWAAYTHGARTPMAGVIRPRLPRRMPRPMPDPDVIAALQGAPDRVYPALMLATYAGFRACEIAACRTDHALPDAEVPVVVIPLGKGGSPSAVALHPALVEMFHQLPRTGWVVPRLDGGTGQSGAWRVSQIANIYLRSIGINHTLHTLRHWFGTKTYQASGRDLRVTQEALRHLSIASTVGYTWIDPGNVATAIVGLPRVNVKRIA